MSIMINHVVNSQINFNSCLKHMRSKFLGKAAIDGYRNRQNGWFTYTISLEAVRSSMICFFSWAISLFFKWKTTSSLINVRRPELCLLQMEDTLNILLNGRQPLRLVGDLTNTTNNNKLSHFKKNKN